MVTRPVIRPVPQPVQPDRGDSGGDPSDRRSIVMTGRPVPSLRPWLTPTVRQMMKLVVFAAVASLCLVPMVHWAEIDAVSWPFVVLMEAVTIPMVLALVAFPLVKKGPLKDWLIRALLLTSVGVILGAASYSLFWGAVGPQSLNLWARSTGMTVGFLWEVIVVLGFPFLLLLRNWCPAVAPSARNRGCSPTRQSAFRTEPRQSRSISASLARSDSGRMRAHGARSPLTERRHRPTEEQAGNHVPEFSRSRSVVARSHDLDTRRTEGLLRRSRQETFGPAQGGVWRPAPARVRCGRNREVIPGLFLIRRAGTSGLSQTR